MVVCGGQRVVAAAAAVLAARAAGEADVRGDVLESKHRQQAGHDDDATQGQGPCTFKLLERLWDDVDLQTWKGTGQGVSVVSLVRARACQ